jgi:hypothetical protein
MPQAAATNRPHQRREAVIGGAGDRRPRWSYALGCAHDVEGGVIVSLLQEVPGIAGMTFEADDFDHAFRRALVIAEDMAEATGHLRDGVLVTLTEYDSLAEIGVDAD